MSGRKGGSERMSMVELVRCESKSDQHGEREIEEG